MPPGTCSARPATRRELTGADAVEGIGGCYFADCNEAEVVSVIRGLTGVRDYALDPVAARRLWEVSLELLDAARGTAALTRGGRWTALSRAGCR